MNIEELPKDKYNIIEINELLGYKKCDNIFHFVNEANYSTLVELNNSKILLNNKYTIAKNWLIGHNVHFNLYRGQKEKAEDRITEFAKTHIIERFNLEELRLYRKFYQYYPQLRVVIADFLRTEKISEKIGIRQGVYRDNIALGTIYIDPRILFDRLSFDYFIELLKIESPKERLFFERYILHHNLSLEQFIEFKNTYKEKTFKLNKESRQYIRVKPILRPQLIKAAEPEFNGYIESKFEKKVLDGLLEKILNYKNNFLLIDRQRTIHIIEKDVRIDLLFYHRVLKCQIVLKIVYPDFKYIDYTQILLPLMHSDLTQKQEDENPAIGIIVYEMHNKIYVKYYNYGIRKETFEQNYSSFLPQEDELESTIRKYLLANGNKLCNI
jgi:predicted nuclease of restriction endonuclease-like (RecB) superfamily